MCQGYVVGTQQLRNELPAVGGQPLLHGFRWGTGVDRLGGEVAGENGSITTHCAGDVEHGSVGLAVAAVLSGEELPGPVGVGAEPGARDVRGADARSRVCPSTDRSAPGGDTETGGDGVATVFWAWGRVPTVALLRWP